VRITIKNHSATIKNTKEGGKKIQLSQKGCVLLHVLIPIFIIANARTCKGVPFVDLFFAFV